MSLKTRLTTGLAAAAVMAGSVPLAAAANFGAIAYSNTTGAYGYSYDYGSRRSAEQAALANCRSNGSGCKVVIWFQNSCGALAIGSDFGWGAAWASSRSQAERSAMRYCRQNSSGCHIAAYSCTTR